MLVLLIGSPFLSAWFTLVSGKRRGFVMSLLPFILALFIFLQMDWQEGGFQHVMEWGRLRVGIDGVSLSLILLTTFLTPIGILLGRGYEEEKLYSILFLVMEGLILGVFCVLDLFLFYVFFESILIPMVLILGIYGSRERKIQAAYQFFLYTFLGSLFMLVGIIYLHYLYGSSDMEYLSYQVFGVKEERVLWLLFFLSFAIKIPMVPFHIWLPEAHVEAPTGGSVILAGVLLKLGAYGLYRVSLYLFPQASLYFTPLVFLLSSLSVLSISLTALRQIDLKKLIAYSSIAHMGYVTYGLFTGKLEGIQGALVTLMSHGWISGGLFLTVGMVYDRYKTRLIKYYRGLVLAMPIYSSLKFLLVLANMGLPMMSSFIGELLILIGLVQIDRVATVIACLGVILSGVYMIWYYNRMIFGDITPYLFKFSEMSFREWLSLMPLILFIVWMGLAPNGLLMMVTPSILRILN